MASPRRIYRVEVTGEMLVYAESQTEAERIAEDNYRELSGYDMQYWPTKVGSAKGMCKEDRDSLPWTVRNLKDERADAFDFEPTVGDLLDAIAEEEKIEREIAEFNARQVPLPLDTEKSP